MSHTSESHKNKYLRELYARRQFILSEWWRLYGAAEDPNFGFQPMGIIHFPKPSVPIPSLAEMVKAMSPCTRSP